MSTFCKCNRIEHTPQTIHPKYLNSNQNPTLPILHQEIKATNVTGGNGIQQIFKGCCTFDPSKVRGLEVEIYLSDLWSTHCIRVKLKLNPWENIVLFFAFCLQFLCVLHHLLIPYLHLNFNQRNHKKPDYPLPLHPPPHHHTRITPPTSPPEEGHWFRPCSELTPYSANGESIHLRGPRLKA